MEYRIVLSRFAENQLDNIYDYYSKEANVEVAQKLIFQIRDRTKILAENPLIGKREEFLLERSEEYRHLIVTNYKIIYSVDEQNRMIKIADVFDTRQNPIKLKRN